MTYKTISIKKAFLPLLLAAALCCAACSPKGTKIPAGNNGQTAAPGVTPAPEVSLPTVDFDVAPAQGSTAGITANTSIVLADDGIQITGQGAFAEGNRLTITAQGEYLITGTLSNGKIYVDTADTEKVKLYLNGVSVTCADGAPFVVISAPKKVILYTVKGSVNLFTDAAEYVIDEAAAVKPDSTLFSKEDLKLDGEGALYISAHYNDAVTSKDDLEIAGGSLYISSADDGLCGKDSVEITGGYVYINAGGDGIKSTNDEKENKGFVSITDGTLDIEAGTDGIQAVTALTVSGGTVNLKTGGGSVNSSKGQGGENNTWGQWGGGMGGSPGGMGGKPGGGPGGMGGGPGGMGRAVTSDSTSPSAKGLKCDGPITLSGGVIAIDSSDDAVHSNQTITVTGGVFTVSSGDDGFHADETLSITGGTININESYEGLEALTVEIAGGTVHVTSSDDGVNAAGGRDGSSVNGRPGQNSFGEGGQPTILIKGGYLVVNASGDGIDSNGSIEMSGGTVIVYGPSDNGNGALDYDRSFTCTGGFLLAAGSAGMAQSISKSQQPVIAFTCGNITPGTLIHIEDDSGKDVLTFASQKAFASVVFTSPELSDTADYAIYSGGSHSGTVTDGLYSGGSYTAGTKLGDYSF